MSKLAHLLIVAALLPLSVSMPVAAQEAVLSPTLANIKRTHTVRLGHREASPPFSYLDRANRPIGYSLDLCKAIVDEIGIEIGAVDLRIVYVKVTPETRIPAVLNNKIDIECGATTASPDRARRVAFSPMMYVAGTKLMVPNGSAVSGIADLRGKTIVVTSGTTNERAIEIVNKQLSLGLAIIATTDHEQSYQLLSDGMAQAFATDDILLYGLIARHEAQDRFEVVGEFLSYDPYGIMYRKNEPQLAAVVERTFRKLATNRDLVPLYQKWLMDRLPTGERLGVPMSAELEYSFKRLEDWSQGTN
ncbi:amino acid ABC transporter substrate-binding protein [Reyranella sp.]|uniref:amino acid ABC transporter substrate-binding protein n=1 Tax=Reyranella sp. TaxID=1929291 RepID=UPI003D1021C3